MNEVSSIVPDGMSTMFGTAAASHTTVDPHSGQKRRFTGLPLPPGLVNVLFSPSALKVSSALRAALTGESGGHCAPAAPAAEIALFPQEWLRDPSSPYITQSDYDLPREEPELMRFYGKTPLPRPVQSFRIPKGSLRKSAAPRLRTGQSPSIARRGRWPVVWCSSVPATPRRLCSSFRE
jgi:hypothetical protein